MMKNVLGGLVVIFYILGSIEPVSGQDSRDLNEPLNNIDNGPGIFTSFNSDVLYFEVVKP